MKKVYLVKKNPEMPAGKDNWIVMNSYEYNKFLETPEGKKRDKGVGQLNGCDTEDVIIFAECGEEKAKEWRKDVNRDQYLRILKQEAGYTVFSYNAITGDQGEDLTGEDLIRDESESVEETVVVQILKEELRVAILSLTESDRDLIEKLFLREHPLTETEYAKLTGSTRNRVHERKRTVLRQLRAMLGSK